MILECSHFLNLRRSGLCWVVRLLAGAHFRKAERNLVEQVHDVQVKADFHPAPVVWIAHNAQPILAGCDVLQPFPFELVKQTRGKDLA